MYRHRPTINSICEPLLGTPIRDRTGAVTGVRYPMLAERCRIYRESLEVVYVFRDYEDLFTLAMYRRQVSDTGMFLDLLFLELALAASLTPEQWQELLIRMPEDTPIRRACERRACPVVAYAAE